MTDEMPPDIAGQRLDFLTQFLLVALAKNPLTFGIGSLDLFVGVILADGHQADTLWQVAQHLAEITFYVVHR